MKNKVDSKRFVVIRGFILIVIYHLIKNAILSKPLTIKSVIIEMISAVIVILILFLPGMKKEKEEK